MSQFRKFSSPNIFGKVNNHKLGNFVVDYHISIAVLRHAPWLNAGTIG